MASTGVNVLRWSALGLGLFYGFTHQRSITRSDRIAEEKHAYEHQEKLIQRAKAEYARKNAPAKEEKKTSIFSSSGSGDGEFDLEKFLLSKGSEMS